MPMQLNVNALPNAGFGLRIGLALPASVLLR